ncbi:uncharacterized protein DUF397 [Stackebrandtia albiflava]|uniref:Uncharacterized protein DUF397 n=1 Tax=Stackebrandtia albiflava TaxID=406432 RepID=A0A562V400_9ACTN|nr:DUF397 domain-containing protein [Stackebrandtia albiflava]TWJ12558.1 uncharacterized protein DUF397 [Stackebrandtia albiflava]
MAVKWRKSSRSGGNQGNCVEARANGYGYEVRDSKTPALGALAVSAADWRAFLTSVR